MSTPQVSTPSPQPLNNLPTRLALTAFAAMAAEASTFPLDTLKTRLQLQRNSLHSRPSTKLPPLITRFTSSYSGESVPSSRPLGAFRTAFSIVRTEGVQGLYQGLTPALARHVVYTSIRITLYEQARVSAMHVPPLHMQYQIAL